MEKHKWAKEIHAWADGNKIERQHWSTSTWTITDFLDWDNPNYKFRIADLYRELKEALTAGKEIWFRPNSDIEWKRITSPEWGAPITCYQIRDKPKPKRKVKLYQWLHYSLESGYTIGYHTEQDRSHWKSIVRRLDETMIEIEVDN